MTLEESAEKKLFVSYCFLGPDGKTGLGFNILYLKREPVLSRALIYDIIEELRKKQGLTDVAPVVPISFQWLEG